MYLAVFSISFYNMKVADHIFGFIYKCWHNYLELQGRNATNKRFKISSSNRWTSQTDLLGTIASGMSMAVSVRIHLPLRMFGPQCIRHLFLLQQADNFCWEIHRDIWSKSLIKHLYEWSKMASTFVWPKMKYISWSLHSNISPLKHFIPYSIAEHIGNLIITYLLNFRMSRKMVFF